MKSLKGNPTRGLFGPTLGFFAGFAAVALFGPTAKRFQEIMEISPALVGLLVAAPSLSGSLLRIPFGAWVDTTGGRKPFLILLWLSVFGMLGLLLVVHFLYPDRMSSNLYPLLLVLGILCGCGIATFSVGIGQVAYWFPKSRQGAALGAYAGLGNLAPGLFSFLLPLVLGSWGLGGAYLAWLLFLLLGVVVYHFTGLNAYYFQLRQQGATDENARVQAAALGQEIFPNGNAKESLKNLAPGGYLFHDIWGIHCTDSLAAYLLDLVLWGQCSRGWRADSFVFAAGFCDPRSRRFVFGQNRWRADRNFGTRRCGLWCHFHDSVDRLLAQHRR